MDLKEVFRMLSSGRNLSRDQARVFFLDLMNGRLPEPAVGAVVGALLVKGVSVDELTGAALAMRARAIRVRCAGDAIDTCGTGGDGISTFNVSTTAAIIAASAGATVAKHGNRSTTRASGSTEVLTILGIDTEAPVRVVEQCLDSVRIGYLNARLLHPAMKHAAPVRQAVPVRTIFNLLGPLTNPAGVRRQVLGVPRPELGPLLAQALCELGADHAWVVHGSDGLCDLTITGPTSVTEVRSGRLRSFVISPEDAGLRGAALSELLVDSPQGSAERIMAILRGQPGPCRDHALLNAGAALLVAGRAVNIRDAVEQAGRAVESGAALATLEEWRKIAGAPPAN